MFVKLRYFCIFYAETKRLKAVHLRWVLVNIISNVHDISMIEIRVTVFLEIKLFVGYKNSKGCEIFFPNNTKNQLYNTQKPKSSVIIGWEKSILFVSRQNIHSCKTKVVHFISFLFLFFSMQKKKRQNILLEFIFMIRLLSKTRTKVVHMNVSRDFKMLSFRESFEQIEFLKKYIKEFIFKYENNLT